MENYEENKKIDAGGKEHFDAEEVPEPWELMRTGTGAADDGEGPPRRAKPAAEQDFQFPLQSGSGLGMLLKLLVQTAQQQAGVTPELPDERKDPFSPATKPAPPEPVAPGAIEPTSNGWVLWAAIIILAAFYFLTK